MLFIHSDFVWKYLFWANFTNKMKILSLSWKLVQITIWICRIQWCCSLFLVLTGYTLLGKILYLKLKFGTYISQIYRIHKSLTFIQFSPDIYIYIYIYIYILGKFGRKNQNYQFNLKFGALINSKMHASLVTPFFQFWIGNNFLGKFGQEN